MHTVNKNTLKIVLYAKKAFTASTLKNKLRLYTPPASNSSDIAIHHSLATNCNTFIKNQIKAA